MYDEADLLPISALQHLAFCERQWALIHLEGMWAENRLTVEGHHLHDRTHKPETESRGDVRTARALRLRSLRLGLTGIADVVEFHRVANAMQSQGVNSDQRAPGVRLPGVPGLWQPMPVEYKRGRPKLGPYDELQLCAQALCLEELLGVEIPSAALFYGQPRQRLEVLLTAALREQTERLAARLHELTRARKTPTVRYAKKCDSCSLLRLCMPKTTGGRKSIGRYLSGVIDQDGQDEKTTRCGTF
jgi:CRISPR-associated exonuclease Cas4